MTRIETPKANNLDYSTVLVLPFDLHPIILSYLCPLDEHSNDVLCVLVTKYKTSLVDWTRNLLVTTCEKGKYGGSIYVTRVNGKIHSVDDKPAIINEYGENFWYKNGQLHRGDDKPAHQGSLGYKGWYIEGKQHRADDKPAIEYSNGDKLWYIDGELHRGDDDKPAMECVDGGKYWYKKGKFCRDNTSPMIEY